jgi:hypothetical protein
MPLFEKHFTVEEATDLLPELREILGHIKTLRDKLVIDVEGALPVIRKMKENGGGPEANAYLDRVHDLNGRLRRLGELGVQIKDVDKGLVDFPAWRGDQEILLCWHLGEEAIRFWHTAESGFSGRQPLE